MKHRREEGREKRRFKYRETDAGDARRVASGGGQFDSIVKSNVKQWKCGEGKQHIRILPRTWNDDEGPRHWGFEAFVHYGVGADNSTYLCPQKMKGDRCPICEERAEVAGKDEQAAKDLRAAKVVLVWIIDRRNPGEGPQLWRMPAQKVAQEIMERSDDPSTGRMLKVDHPEKGYDITFRKEGSQRNTDYVGVAFAREASPLSEDDAELEEWLDYVSKNPVPSVLNFYDADHLEKVFGGASPKDDEDDEDEPPKRGKASKKPVDDDDEDEPPRRGKAAREEDDDEDEPPKRGKARRDDDEDDEEEAPRKSKKASRDDDDDEDDEDDEDDDDIEDIDEPDDDDEEDADEGAKGERRRGTRDDDDDEDEPPRKSKKAARDDDDDDDAPPSRAKSVRDSVSSGLKRRRRDE